MFSPRKVAKWWNFLDLTASGAQDSIFKDSTSCHAPTTCHEWVSRQTVSSSFPSVPLFSLQRRPRPPTNWRRGQLDDGKLFIKWGGMPSLSTTMSVSDQKVRLPVDPCGMVRRLRDDGPTKDTFTLSPLESGKWALEYVGIHRSAPDMLHPKPIWSCAFDCDGDFATPMYERRSVEQNWSKISTKLFCRKYGLLVQCIARERPKGLKICSWYVGPHIFTCL